MELNSEDKKTDKKTESHNTNSTKNNLKGKKEETRKMVNAKRGKTNMKGKGGVKALKGEKLVNKYDEDDDDLDDNDPGSKFLNNDDGSNKKITFMFIIVALVTLCPFVIIYIWENKMVSNLDFLFGHLQVICKIPSEIKYSLLFTYENLSSDLEPAIVLIDTPTA